MENNQENTWFNLIDIGSSGGLHPRWKRFGPLIKNIGFEPNKEEFDKLPSSEGCQWINVGLAGEDGPRRIFITKDYQNSSLLEPNMDLIQTLEWGTAHSIKSAELVDCMSLDTVMAREGITPDFLKIDTQGSELEILKSGKVTLRSVVCLELEVEFAELYRNQPLFAEVDQFMRESGFHLVDLSNHVHVKQRGLSHVGGPKGRLISADALYFKNPDELRQESLCEEEIHHRLTAQIMGYLAYQLTDLALALKNCKFANDVDYKPPAFLAAILDADTAAIRIGNYLPCADSVARAIKKIGRLLTPSRSSLWSPELGNPVWRNPC